MLEWPFAAAICRAAGQAPSSSSMQLRLPLPAQETNRCMIACLLLLIRRLLHTCPACCIRCIDVCSAAKSLLHIL